jgi:hypothetical protein
MQSIQVALIEGLGSETRTSVLERLKAIPDVLGAPMLKPDAKDPDIARMAIVYFNDNASPAHVSEVLAALPEVVSAHKPAARELIW